MSAAAGSLSSLLLSHRFNRSAVLSPRKITEELDEEKNASERDL